MDAVEKWRELASKEMEDESGKVNRLELLPPFVYLTAIAEGGQSPMARAMTSESSLGIESGQTVRLRFGGTEFLPLRPHIASLVKFSHRFF